MNEVEKDPPDDATDSMEQGDSLGDVVDAVEEDHQININMDEGIAKFDRLLVHGSAPEVSASSTVNCSQVHIGNEIL